MEFNRSRRVFTLSASAALLLASCASMEQDGQAALARADRAMGGVDLRTLRYTAAGTGGTFGQAYLPGQAWPRLTISSYSREIDYSNGALREESARSRAEPLILFSNAAFELPTRTVNAISLPVAGAVSYASSRTRTTRRQWSIKRLAPNLAQSPAAKPIRARAGVLQAFVRAD